VDYIMLVRKKQERAVVGADALLDTAYGSHTFSRRRVNFLKGIKDGFPFAVKGILAPSRSKTLQSIFLSLA
jgi:hypothetical protein